APQRRFEEQFRQAHKRETLGRLAGGVAHDLNNLLTVILGYCESLLAACVPTGPVREYLGEIKKAGESATTLTRRVLALCRKPAAEQAAAVQEQAPPAPLAGRGSETILLVEDEPQVREMISGVLHRQEYTVLDAGHGDEALRLATRHRGPIHLLLT